MFGGYSSDSQIDPRGPASGWLRVVRGGGWHVYASLCRAAIRDYHYPTYSIDRIGFRSVLPPGQ